MKGDVLHLVDKNLAQAAEDLVEQARPLFAGKGPDVQGAALADLLALWLAGNRVRHDPAAQTELREALLKSHIEIVRLLLPLADAEIDRMMEARRCPSG